MFDKYSSTSFWLSVYQQNFMAKSIKYYNPPPPVLWLLCFVFLFNHIVFYVLAGFNFICTAAHVRFREVKRISRSNNNRIIK